MPKVRANHGATYPNPAKQRTGSVVSSPAVVDPMPRPLRISSRTGPTLTAAGRRLNASTTSPSTSNAR